MNESTKAKLYNMGLDLSEYAIVISVVLAVMYFILPLDIGFVGGCIAGVIIGSIVSWPVLKLIEKYKKQ